MIHATVPSSLQRSKGSAFVALQRIDGRAALTHLRQQGSAKAVLIHAAPDPEVVFLNTSGGLTGGDSLHYGARIGAGLCATLTTQTAERAYRSGEAVARVAVDIEVGAGGFVDWLPQETILFDGSALERRSTIRLGPGAGCLMAETIVLGRAAMGEVVSQVHLRDRREVWQADRPLWAEPLALTSATLATGPAGLNGQRAFASVCLVAAGAEALLAPLRRLLDEPGVSAAASALPGRLTLRAAAPDGWPLRRLIARCLPLLRQGRPIPRVWQS